MEILTKSDCPPKFKAVVRQLHDDMLARNDLWMVSGDEGSKAMLYASFNHVKHDVFWHAYRCFFIIIIIIIRIVMIVAQSNTPLMASYLT